MKHGEISLEEQSNVWKQFCQSYKGNHYQFELKQDLSYNDMKEEDLILYQFIWQDFVFVRYNLIFGELKNLFLSFGVDEKDFKHFVTFYKFYRNQAAILPMNSHIDEGLYNENFSEYKEMMKYFKSSPIGTYLIIYNCIFNIIYSFNGYAKPHGFEQTFESMDEFEETLSDHLLKQFAQTNIFGTFILDSWNNDEASLVCFSFFRGFILCLLCH